MTHLLIRGDARRLPLDLGSVDAVVTDPPYGIRYRHGAGGNGFSKSGCCRINTDPVKNDELPFDPALWLLKPCLFWGANHFAKRLPAGSWLAWDKVDGKAFGDSHIDCDFAWCSRKGIKRNIFRYTWKGACCVKADEHNGRGGMVRHHPSQKPIALMRWCIQLLDLPPGSLILDPYMGSGTTGIAALAEGHRFVGIEIDARYLPIAARRIERPHAAIPRPDRAKPMPLFPSDCL